MKFYVAIMCAFVGCVPNSGAGVAYKAPLTPQQEVLLDQAVEPVVVVELAPVAPVATSKPPRSYNTKTRNGVGGQHLIDFKKKKSKWEFKVGE